VHAIFFGMKRAFQSSLKIARRMLARFGITPARFDLMYVLQSTHAFNRMKQCHVWLTLGVTGATVSRMVKSLVGLGLVVRTPGVADKRQRYLYLSDLGRRVLGMAMKETMDSGDAHGIVCRAVVPRYFDPASCIHDLAQFEERLIGVCESFADRGRVFYPWHPDD
jgi:DNA-binding MarR family transcriptional regulator